ncbi:MAG TPA: tellurium resistance protein TerC [Polyangiaceae bacterium]|nr:tellurium resistance protein TerC [Polyangiaceae bacterium]
MLVLLQAVLGFDNLLYISIESKRVAPDKQSFVRKAGLGLAIILRIALLYVIMKLIAYVEEPFWSFDYPGLAKGAVSGHAVIVLFGGAFILYTALKEISHMLSIEDIGEGGEENFRGVGAALFWIILMNLIFSFDSILSALALTKVFEVMATAIVISGIMMIALADKVSEFLKKNRMYEVLGLFILFIVGVMLVSEGGHLAQLNIVGYEIHAMTKSTFYFVIGVLVIVDIVQSRYQKKLRAQVNAERASEDEAAEPATS